MSPSDFTLMGLILESHYAVFGHRLIFAVALDTLFRRYAYTSPVFPSPLPPLPPSPPALWSADQLGGEGDGDIGLTITFPDPSSPWAMTLDPSASSVFYGYPAPRTGGSVTLDGRVLGAVYRTPGPPTSPPAPPTAPDYPLEPSFPGGFSWPVGFRWPSDLAANAFLPWYYVLYDAVAFPILKDLPLAHLK